MNVAALSIDAEWLRDLPRTAQPARVHSVFERVVNLVLVDGRLCTLACRACDDAPDSVVVDLPGWSAMGLQPGDPVRVDARRIALDSGLQILLDGALRWSGALPAYADDETILRSLWPLASEHLAAHGRGVGTGGQATSPTRLDQALDASFRRHVQVLCDALATADAARASEAVGHLVGLGPGLTPAGDDFLVGLLAALHLHGGPAAPSRAIGAHVLRCAVAQTHAISAAALRQAARGRVRARIIDLCAALMGATPAALRQALDRLIALGSGSGSDIALGVLAGFKLHLRASVKSGSVVPCSSPAEARLAPA